MTQRELLHFRNNNTYTSLSTISLLDHNKLILVKEPYTTLYFHNGTKVSLDTYNALVGRYEPFKTTITYDLPDNHVCLTYYQGTLEEIQRIYTNKDNTKIVETLKYLEIKE